MLLPWLLLGLVLPLHDAVQVLASDSRLPAIELFVGHPHAQETSSASAATNAYAGDGSVERPFANLGTAVAAVRALPLPLRCSGGGVRITIAGGVYGGAANRLWLTEADSGCPGAPVTYRASPDDPEPVLLHGGVEVPAASFSKVSTTKAGLGIWAADLKPLGLSSLATSSADFGMDWQCANGKRTELFFGGRAMTLARHPNKEGGNGTWQYLRQGKVLTPTSFSPGTDDSTGKPIPSDPPWAAEKHLFCHGFWTWDWADSFAKVKSIGSGGAVELEGAPTYGIKEGSRYMMVNGLSLLDAPSEYNRTSAIIALGCPLYWPDFRRGREAGRQGLTI